ncbi:SMP-30/gluconolactonase/LRE family protein [Hymenobacter terrenus]|uniref:SMP-30/gluconolactonase/LRE family protein n=1 Tax=Hymenobacter terrenus TaxID=1629124 RepID=UPI0006975FE2|nr:SMP-30/gluconolactonase/LRE family protein [Hymenobacter terrenus]
MNSLSLRLAGVALLTTLAACSDEKNEEAAPATPDTITITRPALYPEGLAYDAANGRFLVSSFTTGAVGQVKDDGTYTTFADDAQLVSSAGIFLDEPRNRVLVAVADPGTGSRTTTATQGKLAALASYNRTTGQRLAYVDLGGLRPGSSHFANDVAVDAQGNAYVTDSFSPIIYKIDAQGNASVFLEDSRLAAPTGFFGLNGIVFHPDGYLLVAKYDDGTLYKVPLTDPSSFIRVASSQVFASADGLLLTDNNTLLVSTNGQLNTVFRVSTTDGWATAKTAGTLATGNVFPTTFTRRGTDVYMLQSYIGSLLAGQTPAVAQFTIQKVKF